METFGLRELRENATDLVRRAEAGERLLISVSGRPVAMLGPYEHRHWRRYEEVAELLAFSDDDTWETDGELIDHEIADPWKRRQ